MALTPFGGGGGFSLKLIFLWKYVYFSLFQKLKNKKNLTEVKMDESTMALRCEPNWY